MANLHFDLVSPEKLLFTGNVRQVDLPGAEGDFGVLAEHAPLIAALRPGVLVIHEQTGEQLRIVIHGGFAEVTPSGLTVLADAAVPADEVDIDVLSGIIKDTEEDVADTTDDWKRDQLARRLAQLRALREELSH
jgi:F-type H+-transporting ATPase subunit epsilon